MSIAEQMGRWVINWTSIDNIWFDLKLSDGLKRIIFSSTRVLQRTSISTNIKERLDFSCAMFGPDGGLVANAPHIPVHLGAMQETVQYQVYRYFYCLLLTGTILTLKFYSLFYSFRWNFWETTSGKVTSFYVTTPPAEEVIYLTWLLLRR